MYILAVGDIRAFSLAYVFASLGLGTKRLGLEGLVHIPRVWICPALKHTVVVMSTDVYNINLVNIPTKFPL